VLFDFFLCQYTKTCALLLVLGSHFHFFWVCLLALTLMVFYRGFLLKNIWAKIVVILDKQGLFAFFVNVLGVVWLFVRPSITTEWFF
jgi:hypothetical protein